MLGISIGQTFSSIMAMVTKYLLGNVKEELGKTKELLEETFQTSRDVINIIDKIEVEFKSKLLDGEIEKKGYEMKIIKLSIENEKLVKKVKNQNDIKQEFDDLNIMYKQKLEAMENMKKKIEKYEFILNIDKYKKVED